MSEHDDLPPSFAPRKARRRPAPDPGDAERVPGREPAPQQARPTPAPERPQATRPQRRSVRPAPSASPRRAPADRTGIPARGPVDDGATRRMDARADERWADDSRRRDAREAGPQATARMAPLAAEPRSDRPVGRAATAPSYPPRRGSGEPDPGSGADWDGGDWDGGGPSPPAGPPPGPPRSRRPRRRRRPGRVIALLLALVLAAVIAWPVGLAIWANGRINHVEALSGAENTTGTTYLLAGSDQRGGNVEDGVEGQRSDSIMVLHVPENGTPSMISLPRDTIVTIPGHGDSKLNTAYSVGGAPLLVQTVEELLGLTIDHYVEIGMSGLSDVVDGVGGVELCLDYDVDDEFSGLQWQAGCHEADGTTALAFSRMRYSDPTGDIGRGERQRQVIGAIADAVSTPATLLDPRRHVSLARTGTDALTTDEDTGIVDLGRLALAFRSASNGGFVGTPPIADPGYSVPGLGSTVLLDEEAMPAWLESVRDGTISPSDAETEAPAGG
jgi:LCP family protein required for cell wall assembly